MTIKQRLERIEQIQLEILRQLGGSDDKAVDTPTQDNDQHQEVPINEKTMSIDADYSLFKVKRHYGSIDKAAEHFRVERALLYLIIKGLRGQKSKNTKSREIFDSLIEDNLVVFKGTPSVR